MKLKNFFFLVFFLLISIPALPKSTGGEFTIGNGTFLLNGKPFVIKAAEVHYPRIPRAYWENRIEMCKALGMNTLCLYVFWNLHEQGEDQFDFRGNKDVAAFCRLAQKHGMYVIVRPGPYVCAEWEMGGLPWWLLKKKDIRLRDLDPYFMQRVKIFEEKVAQQLAPLSIQHGGPIIMVQVENEYGSYGVNKPYVSAIRDMLRTLWGNTVLFQCDWSSNFEKNGLDDLLWTMNFGTGADIDQQFKRLGELRPLSPKMCSEFWSGWFDKWGAKHETRPAEAMVSGIDEMLSKGISFSLYMTHGGTSFGHWAGANSPGFAPDVTSYDYDAPINEYGRPTEKFWELRQVMQKYSSVKLPEVPKPVAPLISIPSFKLEEFVPLVNGVDSMTSGLKTFEDMDMGWGCMIYTTRLPRTERNSILRMEGVHDYACVFLNGSLVGKISRVKNENSVELPPMTGKDNQLMIVVEGMGRINFGQAIKDYKGITGSVTLQMSDSLGKSVYTPGQWKSYTVPDAYKNAVRALEHKGRVSVQGWKDMLDERRIGYYRGFFDLKKTGDTFLNMEAFGKGQVYVNGHPLGRFWHIGPQQTLYLPGCWLKKGRNEVIVLDITGHKNASVCYGQDKPELNLLHQEYSLVHNQPADQPDLNSMTPVATGSFTSGNGWQTVTFGQPATGRYLAIQILNNQDGGEISSIAELYAMDSEGRRLNRDSWVVKYADSEDILAGNHTGEKVFDLQESTYWSTVKGIGLPHLLVLDMGKIQTVSALEYLPRAEEGAPGSVGRYQLYLY